MDTTGTFTETHIRSVIRWTNGLHTLAFPRPSGFSFIPGQYIRVGLPIEDTLVIRPYSVACAPDADDLELYVNASTDEHQGTLSTRLIQLHPGDNLQFDTSSAYGYLTLNEVPQSSRLWLLATGVGLAPFLAILRDASVFERFHLVYLVHSCRYITELGYANEIKELEKTQNRFHYLPFVTRENQADIYTGRITDALQNGTLESITHTAIGKQDQFMICGNPGLVNDCTAILQERGLTRNRRKTPGNITVEKFW